MLSTFTTSLLVLTVTVALVLMTRHVRLVRGRRTRHQARPRRSSLPLPPQYYVFVLGSGGHTKEMLMMMDDGFCDFANLHRRYLVSSGDATSLHQLHDYEAQLTQLCRVAGTRPGSFDVRLVARARRVYQPLWTTPWTALRSFLDILPVLLSSPDNYAPNRPHYPTQIFANGPATALFVALAAHVLKVLWLVPQNSMRFIYIESWARISSLSLTGKILYYACLADVFYVQHAPVAAAYGLTDAGEMVFNSRRPDVQGRF
ncbi:hypothetical protein CDD82_5231 [Ophiocordyceps australis]|uniref:UDP-N-acetylglucosamine transferase subunit ALG14 n=1 Tax=Ophiocordyceps australis TaxID=1399860 RepID=A0A2C5Z3D0_9HYPO|nr:hypothetical protein CDD82_5231 [Ophiocordyceps australis]